MRLNHRVKSYTLMELAVVLVLSGILFLLAFQALQFVQSSYLRFSKKNASLVKVKTLVSQLKKDCSNSESVTAGDQKITCVIEKSVDVSYQIAPSFIVRSQGHLQDTFLLENTTMKCYFNQTEVSKTGSFVDEIVLETIYQKEKLTFSVTKVYGADKLMQIQMVETNGNDVWQ